jgi:uncharacterized protein YjbI with pentapeptide repeats
MSDRMNFSKLTPPTPQLLADLKNGHANTADLQNCDLKGTDLQGAKLIGLDLTSLDLRGTDLRGADLTHTNLTGAYLHRALLQKANLSQANLTDAKLQVAYYDSETQWPEEFAYKSVGAIGPASNLTGAYLNTANFRDAELQGTNFLGAYLSGADFTGANLAGAKLSGANLRRSFLIGAYRAADLHDVEMDNLESIAGADFGQVQGLSDRLRGSLLNRPASELDVWNSFTRRTTRQSLMV